MGVEFLDDLDEQIESTWEKVKSKGKKLLKSDGFKITSILTIILSIIQIVIVPVVGAPRLEHYEKDLVIQGLKPNENIAYIQWPYDIDSTECVPEYRALINEKITFSNPIIPFGYYRYELPVNSSNINICDQKNIQEIIIDENLVLVKPNSMVSDEKSLIEIEYESPFEINVEVVQVVEKKEETILITTIKNKQSYRIENYWGFIKLGVEPDLFVRDLPVYMASGNSTHLFGMNLVHVTSVNITDNSVLVLKTERIYNISARTDDIWTPERVKVDGLGVGFGGVFGVLFGIDLEPKEVRVIQLSVKEGSPGNIVVWGPMDGPGFNRIFSETSKGFEYSWITHEDLNSKLDLEFKLISLKNIEGSAVLTIQSNNRTLPNRSYEIELVSKNGRYGPEICEWSDANNTLEEIILTFDSLDLDNVEYVSVEYDRESTDTED